MTYERLAYDDAAPTAEMVDDCSAVGRELHVPTPRAGSSEEPTPHLVVSDALARMAAGLELHHP